jgi:DNA-binding winged helix-turn-helix (wHTH) protein/tetratricopeptide (TPR) repeat protein
MSNSVKHFYEFGPFRLDVANRLLLRGGEPLPLAPKAVDTLLALVEHGGDVLRKDDLMKLVWPNHIVEEGNLTQNIYLLRKTLGKGSNGEKYIETLPRRGYRFVGEVRSSQNGTADLNFGALARVQGATEAQEGNGEKKQLSDNGSAGLLSRQTVAAPPQTTLSPAPSLPGRGRLRVLILPGVVIAFILIAALFYQAFSDKSKPPETLSLRLSATEQKLPVRESTENPEAYQAYTRGRYYWSKQTAPALEEAIKYFEQALRYDPDYALAYAGLSDAYSVLGAHYDTLEQSQSDALPKAKEAALHALKLNDLLAESHTALGVVKQGFDRDWSGAESEFKRAIELNPNYAYAHQAYALHLAARGQLDAATTEIKRARELDSLSLSINRDLGRLLYFAHEYDQAIKQFYLALKIDLFEPLSIPLRRLLAWTYEHNGMHERAVAEFIEILRLQKTSPERLDALRQAYDAGGMKGYWRKWLELQRERIRRGQLSPFYLAQIYAFIGAQDRAFAYLQKAYEDRSLGLAALRYDPSFDDLRADQRYLILLGRLGLTHAPAELK